MTTSWGSSRELLVEAHVVARLLGVRLLTLEASVIVVPAPPNGRGAGEVFAPCAIGTRLAAAERLLGSGK